MSQGSRFSRTIRRKSVMLAFLSGLFPFFVLLFQNCSQSPLAPFGGSGFFSSSQSESPGGNGESYDGKPIWSRLVPGLTCADQSAAVGSLQINNDGGGETASIVTNENACLNLATIVSIDALERSTFSERYIGYKDGVYTHLRNRDENIAKGIFTEAWCRAMNPDRTTSAYEFAVEWEEAGQVANLSSFDANNSAPVPLASTRELQVDRVIYRTPDGALQINLAQKIPGSYKVTGVYAGRVDGAERQVGVECLMGGQFDPVAPKFELSGPGNQTLAVGETLESITPIVNKPFVRFSIDNILPAGLQFDPTTGSISGVAKALMPRQKFGISATFAFGKITRPVSIGVGEVATVESGSDFSAAIDRAAKISPTPLLIKLNAPSIDLAGSSFMIRGDVSVSGTQTFRTVLNAHSQSNHFEVKEGSFLDLHYLALSNGQAQFGGSIHTSRANLVIRDCVFENNQALENGHGGAIDASESSLLVANSEFISNKAFFNNANGGAIYISQPQETIIRDSRFRGNQARMGGAIFASSGSHDVVRILNSTFETSYAFSGAAIMSQFSPIAITDSLFVNNEAIFEGGAVTVQSADHAWIERSKFQANKGGGFGAAAIHWWGNIWGGYRAYNSVLYVLESDFTQNKSLVPNAGSIFNLGGEVVLRGTKFYDNNTPRDCQTLDPIHARFESLGGNSSRDGTCPL